MPSIRTLLIANRHEIALRVMRTARDMGIATVAVFTDADADSAHVRHADEAVRLDSGSNPSAHTGDAYLDIESVLDAARRTGAGAIHPGYGFLAENADFAARVEGAGLIFVGPTPESIRTMGDKARSKALASEIGVPVLDGFEIRGFERQDVDSIAARIDTQGLPVVLKAVAGGGGKGMRVVTGRGELAEALEGASREARSAFGNGDLIVERYLESPRHVEIQVLADHHGSVLHLFERDCSIQRRHQKVFEEAPAPGLSDGLRSRMTDAAIALAKAVDYRGAGTVEMMVDGDDFYFLEMNTRLQVEHPVTETITGIDLVRAQIEIAEDRPLAFTQDDLAIRGHAIEARLYAEDPARDFLPSTGTINLWSMPEGKGVRVDSGFDDAVSGYVVSPAYDPLLAKIIAHGRDRDEAQRRLAHALRAVAVGGVATNRDLLLAVLDDPRFQDGGVDTAFLASPLPGAEDWLATPDLEDLAPLAMAAIVSRIRAGSAHRSSAVPPGWRNNRWRPQRETLRLGDRAIRVEWVACDATRYRVTVSEDGCFEHDDRFEHDVRWTGDTAGGARFEIDGIRRGFRIAWASAARVSVHGNGLCVDFQIVPRFPESKPRTSAGACAAPMTGKVVALAVAAGDTVRTGDTLVIIEAMKMEHRLTALYDGRVESIHVDQGDSVDPDDVLVVVTPADASADDA